MLFGTSGIRGEVGSKITPELVYRIARITGDYSKRVFVGRDARSSGKYLEEYIVSGLIESGSDGIICGILPTPSLSYVCAKEKSFGIMITASHNPPSHNGIKILDSLGKEISIKIENEIEKKFNELNKEKSIKAKSNSSCFGQVGFEENVFEKHIEHNLSFFNLQNLEKKRILIDGGNGAGSFASPLSIRNMGGSSLTLNCEYSGSPNRLLEPTNENLKETISLAGNLNLLGAAHDGDCDRTVLFDGKGLIGLDEQLALMIEALVQTKGKGRNRIVSTVEASLLIREVCEAYDCELIITPVGSRNIAEKMIEKKALFGGEPCGEYIFNNGILCPDALFSIMKFYEMLSMNGKERFRRAKNNNFMARDKLFCRELKKKGALERIKKKIRKFEGKISLEDGIRVDFDEGWFLIRPSGTEEIMRITLEHKSKKKGEELHGKLRKIVKESV